MLPDEAAGGGSVTPGTSVISLEALFRTVSMHQGTGGPQKPPGSSQPAPHMDK